MKYVALFFLLPSVAFADLTQCNGVWVNEPCVSGVSDGKTLSETKFDIAKYEGVKKREIIDGLYNLIKGYKISSPSIVSAIAACKSDAVSFDDCKARARDVVIEVDPQVREIESRWQAERTQRRQATALEDLADATEQLGREQAQQNSILQRMEYNQRWQSLQEPLVIIDR